MGLAVAREHSETEVTNSSLTPIRIVNGKEITDISNKARILVLGQSDQLKVNTILVVEEDAPSRHPYKEYQWYTVDPITNGKKAIEGAIANSYTITNEALGKVILVEMRFGNEKLDGELLVDVKASIKTKNAVNKPKMPSPNQDEVRVIEGKIEEKDGVKNIAISNLPEKYSTDGGTLQYVVEIDGELIGSWKEAVVSETGVNMGLITDPALNNVEVRNKVILKLRYVPKEGRRVYMENSDEFDIDVKHQ